MEKQLEQWQPEQLNERLQEEQPKCLEERQLSPSRQRREALEGRTPG